MSQAPRTARLHEDAIGWLESDEAVLGLISDENYGDNYGGDYGGIDADAPEAIVPAAVAAQVLDEYDPLLAVGSSETTSSRVNHQEAKTFQVRVAAAGSEDLVKTGGGTHRLTRLLDAAKHVLTDHRGQWHARGTTTEESVAWNDATARYVGAAELEYWRQD